jgi:hypothetical protein
MRNRVLAVGAILGALIIIVFILEYQVKESPITIQDMANDITDTINSRAESKAEVAVELTKDIGNYKTAIFSVKGLDGTNPQLGFAFYQKNRWSGKYENEGMG